MIEIIAWIIGTSIIVLLGAALAKKLGLPFLTSAFVASIVIANVIASKIVNFAGFAVPAAVIIFTTAYSLTDLINEFYGKKEAHNAVWIGFYANILLVFATYIAVIWQPMPFWQNQQAFEIIFGMTPRIVLASMTAYLISGHIDVITFALWKKLTKGKHLWLRNLGSNAISLAIDTVIFISIAFYGLFPLFELMLGQYIAKIAISVINAPFVYMSRMVYQRLK
jgi:uncharacterized integral membrane protein (TIGR00697 family)